jgi:hypothetical protein
VERMDELDGEWEVDIIFGFGKGLDLFVYLLLDGGGGFRLCYSTIEMPSSDCFFFVVITTMTSINRYTFFTSIPSLNHFSFHSQSFGQPRFNYENNFHLP